MTAAKHLENLNALKLILDRNTRFLSLSGVSCILAGVFATLGMITATYIYGAEWELFTSYTLQESMEAFIPFFVIASGVIGLTIGCCYYMTKSNIRKKKEPINKELLKNTVINILIPILVGGVLCLIALWEGKFNHLAAYMLIFYGLGLFSGGKFIYNDIKIVGLVFVALGVVSYLHPQWSIYLWTIGFGLVHIIYGARIYTKYERNLQA